MTGTGLLLNNLNPLTVKNAYILPSDWKDYYSQNRFIIIINIIVVVDTVLIFFFFQKSRLRWRKKGENSLWLRSKRTIIIGTMAAEVYVYVLNFSYRFKDHIIVNTS